MMMNWWSVEEKMTMMLSKAATQQANCKRRRWVDDNERGKERRWLQGDETS